eukprot:TRINITY_DN8888_c0_g1_i1.p1 TRINITY_DN8888_c0_g1~~TRINITY_DN8888_c0_g1_i1.p1  ORF type:complete len:577 (+),score=171.98 TRINITY_DN8888_c0_g1_i1:76-1806(+)
MGCAAGKDGGKAVKGESKPGDDRPRKESVSKAKHDTKDGKKDEKKREKKEAHEEKKEKKEREAEKARDGESSPSHQRQQQLGAQLPPLSSSEPKQEVVHVEEPPEPATDQTAAEEEAMEEDGKPVVRGHLLSQPSRAILWYLKYSNKDVKVASVDILGSEHKSEKFLAKHPYGQIPVYEEGDFNLSESTAILQYLARDDKEFACTDAKEEIRVNEYFGIHLSAVVKCSSQCFNPGMFATDPKESERIIKEGAEAIKPILERFDSALSKTQYILGDRITLADFMFAPQVDQLQWIGVLSPYEHIKKYLEMLHESDPSYHEVISEAKAIFDKAVAFRAAEQAAAANSKQSATEAHEGESKVEGKPVVKIHPASQPSRAVMWYIKHTGKDIQMDVVNILAGEHKTEEFLEKHPYGQVPAYEDGDGFVLSEGIAILQHLSKDDEQFQPSDDKDEIKLNEYMGRHLSEIRKFTTLCIRPALGARTKIEAEEAAKKGYEAIKHELEVFNDRLATQDFVLGNKLSLADFLFVPEVDQLEWLGLLDTHPKITAYLERVRETYPEYRELHETAAKMIEHAKSLKE